MNDLIKKAGRYVRLYIPLALVSLGLIVMGLIVDGPVTVLSGLRAIFFSQTQLFCDFFVLGGPGAALVNSGLVCLVSLAILFLAGDPVNGFTFATLGLMAGFSLFGKNPVNMMPIVMGGFLYSRVRREPFSKYSSISLLGASLSPAVSFLMFAPENPRPLAGILLGLIIGFVLPPLAAYTFRIQNGMNLYNAGFACGLMGMVLIPVLGAMGAPLSPLTYWSDQYNRPVGIAVITVCLILIVGGTLKGGKRAWRRYGHLLKTSGRLPSDYVRTFGMSTVCINTGINGLLGLAYLAAIGGDLSGPTVGALIVVMGFSAYGKHFRNAFPVVLGVFLGDFLSNLPMDSNSMQIAGLFGTALAPISGVFGWPFGILAGMLHAATVLYSGSAAGGMNLYNNGFSAGLVAVVLYALLSALLHPKRKSHHDEEFHDIFSGDKTIHPSRLDPAGSEKPE